MAATGPIIALSPEEKTSSGGDGAEKERASQSLWA